MATSRRRTGGNSCRASAKSAGFRSSMVASRALTPCSLGRSDRPMTSPTSTVKVSPLRSPRRPVTGRCTNRRVTFQSWLRSFSMHTSRISTVPDPSRRVTRLSKSSPTTRVSSERWEKRRTLSTPVVITAPGSMAVTRERGTNTRRRPGTSTTSPTARGAERRLIKTTTSTTLPT